jgi:hypothetical protein
MKKKIAPYGTALRGREKGEKIQVHGRLDVGVTERVQENGRGAFHKKKIRFTKG